MCERVVNGDFTYIVCPGIPLGEYYLIDPDLLHDFVAEELDED